jgi:soluble lytic murein transglycosylase-like protein
VAKETDAAIAYFGDLYRQFGDWNLALAAYNQGERHVAQAIEHGGARDALALAEQGQLNDYVATVLAGVVVLGNPEIVD